jgi:hypoxanthine phosphoribosyltransferase
MEKRTKLIIYALAKKLMALKQPIHILAICSGGKVVANEVVLYLKQKKIEAICYEVWTNSMNGKCTVRKSEFKSKDWIGTAVIIDDVIWSGHQIMPVKKMLKKMNPKKKFYVTALLDCNRKADFSVYH